MIDIHSHMLPGVDDGASDLDEALRMAAMAYESGTTYLVLTPHCGGDRARRNNYWSREMFERFETFREEVHKAGIPLKLGYGAEVFATPQLKTLLKEGKLRPLAGSRRLLIEFSFDVRPETIRAALMDVTSCGYDPVLAHPERYDMTAEDPRAIYDWVESGCIMQINKDSLLGRFGRKIQKTAETLLQHGLVHCVASDTHHADVRTPELDIVWRYLERTGNSRLAKVLLNENPYRIITGKEPLKPRSVPFPE